MRLSVHENKIRRSVADWAAQFSVPEEEVRNYNRWVRGNSIPADKTYAVIQAVANPDKEVYLAIGTLPSGAAATPGLSATQAKTGSEVQRINGLVVIVAQSGDKATTLAERAGVELSVFLRNNDLSISDPIIPGQHYFLRKKHARASQSCHTVQASETLWSISQANGLQLKKLKKYNRIETDRDLKAGMTLWLTGMKPRNATQVTEQGPAIEVDATETFSWSPGTTAVESVNAAAVSEVKALPDSSRSAQTKSLPVPADSVTHVEPDVRPREHIVQPGETLYGLSKLYNVPVMDLVNWNQLDLQVGIRPGQKLILEPEQAATSVGEIAPEVTGDTSDLFHEVKSSDTLYSIARKYGVTIKELMEWNNKQDFTLSVGEKLRIRKE
jgi:membrane-bound lytic murein transglycosylase D